MWILIFPDFMLCVCADKRIAWSMLICIPRSGRIEFDVRGFPGIVTDPVTNLWWWVSYRVRLLAIFPSCSVPSVAPSRVLLVIPWAMFTRSSCYMSELLASVWRRLYGICFGGCKNMCFVIDGDYSDFVVMIVFGVKDIISVRSAAFGLHEFVLDIGSNIWGAFEVCIFLYLVHCLVLLFCRYRWPCVE